MTSALQALQFDSPLLNPAPNGLYNATVWDEVGANEPSRFLGAGVTMRPHNFGGDSAFGVWGANWCASLDDLTPADIKDGERDADGLDVFEPMVVWAYDQCDLTMPSQREVRERAAQNLRLLEQNAVERQFATRLWEDVTDEGVATETSASIIEAVAHIESEFAKTNTIGLVHAPPAFAARAAEASLLIRSGNKFTTPLGHQWVFGGGYIDVLGDAMIATSPTYGWRDEVAVRDAIKQEWNQYVAVAERAVLVAYEAVIAAAGIS